MFNNMTCTWDQSLLLADDTGKEVRPGQSAGEVLATGQLRLEVTNLPTSGREDQQEIAYFGRSHTLHFSLKRNSGTNHAHL